MHTNFKLQPPSLRLKRISSRMVFFHKKFFPILWFGFLGFFIWQTLTSNTNQMDLFFLVGPCVMAVFGFFLMKKLVWDLADDVYDCGDHLLVRKGRNEERVMLTNIMNVSSSTFMNPPRFTLRLINSSLFGDEIVFSPVFGFTINPFARSKVAEDLMCRVDQARANRMR